MKRFCSRRSAMILSAASAVSALISNQAFAVSSASWIGTTSGNWSDSTKWRNGVLPVSGVDSFEYFTASGTNGYTATNNLTSPFTLSFLYTVNSSTSAATINGNPLQFVDSAAFTQSAYLSQQGSGATTLANNITLPGQLRVFGQDTGTLTISGQISGAGSLASNSGGDFDPRHIQVTGVNAFTGGSKFQSGGVWVRGSGTLGSGSINIGNDTLGAATGGRAIFDSSSNVASGDGSIHVHNSGIVQFNNMSAASLARIASDSTGVLAVPASSDGATIPFSVSLFNLPGMRLGTNLPTGITSTSIGALLTPANNTYEFGGAAHATGDTLRVGSPLVDFSGTTSLDFGSSPITRGGRLVITGTSNSYTGGTVVEAQTDYGETNLVFDYTPATGQTPLGTGSLSIFGQLTFEGAAGSVGALPNAINFQPGSSLLFNNVLTNGNTSSTQNLDRWGDSKPLALNGTLATLNTFGFNEKVGATTYADGSSLVINSNSNGNSTFETASLARSNRGTLVLTAPNGRFGSSDKFKVTSAAGLADATTGMISPSIIGDVTSSFFNPGEFLTVDANNVLQVTPYTANFDPTSDHEIVSPGTPEYLTADDACWAARLGETHISPSKTLILRSGGLICYGPISGGTVQFLEVNTGTWLEALVYVGAPESVNGSGTISSTIMAQAGFTKFGAGELALTSNNDIIGAVQVQGGTLRVADPNALGVPGNNSVLVSARGGLILNGIALNVASISGAGSISSLGSSTLSVGNNSDTTFSGQLFGAGGNALALTKYGPGALTLTNQLSAFTGSLTVQNGTVNFNGFNRSQANCFTFPQSYLNFNASNGVNRIDGQGMTQVQSLNSYSTTTLTANTIRQTALNVIGNSIVALRASNGVNDASHLFTLSLGLNSASPTATFDLADNDLVVGSGTPKSTVEGFVRNARNAGQWNRPGLTSSSAAPAVGSAGLKPTGLGVISAAEYQSVNAANTVFDGIVLASSDTLVKYTWNGDADFNGKIDAADYHNIDTGYQNQHNSGFTFDWFNGDFDYNGVINSQDYALIDSAFQLQSGTLRPALDFLETGELPSGLIPDSLATVIEHEEQFGQAYANAFVAANAPEPTSMISAIGFVGLAGMARSRRRETFSV